MDNKKNINVSKPMPEETIEKTMGDYKIMLAPTLEAAQTVKAEATVEAEYGAHVVNGSLVTLAHHGPRSGNPAPCNTEVDILPKGSTILLSHVDLDALGGVMALTGVKPEDPGFWKAAEYIDVNGPHHLHELGGKEQDQLNAIWAWNAQQPRAPFSRDLREVGDSLIPYAKAVAVVADPNHPEHDKMIENGKRWEKETSERVNACLVKENDKVRLFHTDGTVFCSASYYSQGRGEIIPATVQYNEKFKAVTLAFAENMPGVSAEKIMQEIFGPEAGGRAGIAGTPRGHEYTIDDAKKVYHHVTGLLKAREVQQHMEHAVSPAQVKKKDGMSEKKMPVASDFSTVMKKAKDQATDYVKESKPDKAKSQTKDKKTTR